MAGTTKKKRATGEKLLGTGMARRTATLLGNRRAQIDAAVNGTPKKKTVKKKAKKSR